jgi:gliding motility-associated lipoprotein GldH
MRISVYKSLCAAVITLTLLPVSFISCDNKTIYDEYRHTTVTGWEKNDTLFFEMQPVAENGYYSEELGLRINSAYPFTGLCVIVEQYISGKKEIVSKTDTVTCRFFDKNGNLKGNGISNYQFNFHVSSADLKKGERVRFCIRHNMKREILPGISDIGIAVRRLN